MYKNVRRVHKEFSNVFAIEDEINGKNIMKLLILDEKGEITEFSDPNGLIKEKMQNAASDDGINQYRVVPMLELKNHENVTKLWNSKHADGT